MHIEKLPCNMHVHKAGIRDNEAYLFIHAHCKKHNKCTRTHTHSREEKMNRGWLTDAPWQGILLERGDIS